VGDVVDAAVIAAWVGTPAKMMPVNRDKIEDILFAISVKEQAFLMFGYSPMVLP
jgi:hypothetical protein